MAAVTQQIGDAIVDELNSSSRSWPVAFYAVRKNIPRIAREEAGKLHVTVFPALRESVRKTRVKVEDTYTFQIGVQQGVTTGENDQTDALIELCEQIQEHFDTCGQLAGYPVTCISSSYGTNPDSALMSMADAQDAMLFTAIVVLRFMVLR